MPGRRTITNDEIRELLTEGYAMLLEINPPEHLAKRVYSTCVEILQLGPMAMTPAEGMQSIRVALGIVAGIELPEQLQDGALHIAIQQASQREVIAILKDVPGVAQ